MHVQRNNSSTQTPTARMSESTGRSFLEVPVMSTEVFRGITWRNRRGWRDFSKNLSLES